MGSVAPIIFKAPVAAGTKVIKRYDLRKDGTIQRLFNRLYSGSVGTLKIYAWLVDGEKWESILKFADAEAPYISGDDDRDEFNVVIPFKRGCYLEIWAVNDGTYSYDLNMTIELDYYGGQRRVI